MQNIMRMHPNILNNGIYVCISGLHEHFQYITDNNFKINHKVGLK